MSKEKLFSVGLKDCIVTYYNGTGGGGQYRNKVAICCQINHEPSKTIARCESYRSRHQNTKEAFKRMYNQDSFKKWMRIEAARKTGELAKIVNQIESELKNDTKIEVKVNGKWTDEE